MNIGIFGGAFNPVHNGHINLAKNYADSLNLHKVIFIPTAVPPHKTSENLASGEDRFNMLEIALDDERFEVSDIEFKRQGKSYTYDTLIQLKKFYPDDNFYLIIGADQFLDFNSWYRWQDIIKMAVLCTSAREDEFEKKRILDFSGQLGLTEDKFYLSDYPVYKLSSSEIREKIRSGQDIKGLVPGGVRQYIIEKGLYSV